LSFTLGKNPFLSPRGDLDAVFFDYFGYVPKLEPRPWVGLYGIGVWCVSYLVIFLACDFLFFPKFVAYGDI